MKSAGKMMTLFWILFSLVFAGAALFPLMSEASPARPGYVALGDSIEFGVGATDNFGYVRQLHLYLEDVVFHPKVDLHNLGEPGATVRDIRLNQLFPAISEIQNHRQRGVVVSWGGGGNDLLDFIQSPQAASCLQIRSCLARLNALLNEMEQTVDLTLKGLRFFAGPDSAILVRTQYNPLLRTGCDPTGEQAVLATAVLEGAPGTRLEQGLNDRLRALADKHGANVVDIFLPFFLEPDNLIAGDCIHPNDAGHTVILDTAIEAIEELL